MKRTRLAKRNALFTSGSFSYGAMALGLVMLLVAFRIVLPNLFWQAVAPFFTVSNALESSTHTFLSRFENAATLAAKNEELARENEALSNENQVLNQKITDLGTLLGSAPKAVEPGIVAEVVARPPETPYDSLLIAVGSSRGAVTGMEAFGPGNVPLGIVQTVSSTFSQVLLFSSPESAITGSVGKDNAPVTIMGAGGGALTASIARSANIKVGDIVKVPGPGALPIGSVLRVDSDPSSPSVLLRIAPTINPFTLHTVLLRFTGVHMGSASPSRVPTRP